MHFIASLALVLSLQQGLPSDSVVHAILLTRVNALPDTGKHGEGIVVGLLDANGGRRIVTIGVDATGVFEIGSITKVFTASILADMVGRGEVRLDDPVAKYLPASAHIPSRNGRQITLTQSMRRRLQPGHDAEGKVVPNWDLPTLAGAGALRSTANDMLAFLAANLDTTPQPLARAMRDARTPRREAGNPDMRIGLAWHVLARPTGSIVWHNGGTGGYRSFAGFDPVRRVGVVLLCNNGNESMDDLGFHLLDETFPLRPPPAQHTEVAVDSLVLQRWVGEYELAPTFHIVVTREGAHLFAQATAQPRFAIFAESDSTFFLKAVDAQLTFRPDGLVLHQNGQHAPARKLH